MERKLVRHGPSTLMISLPKKWIEKNKLKSGSKIVIKDRGNVIELVPEDIAKENKIIVNLKDVEKRSLKHILGNCYKTGFDEIEINFSKSSFIPLISKELYLMMGFEMVKETKHSCTLKKVSNFEENQFEILRKKILFSIVQMFDLIIDDLKNKSLENSNTISDVKKRIRRFNDFCRRFLVVSQKYESSFYAHYLFLSNCSYLNSLLLYVYDSLKECNSKVYEWIIPIIKTFKQAFEILYNSVLKLNLEKVSKFNSLVVRNKKIIEDMLEKHSGKINLVLAELLKIERTLNQLGGPATGIIILERKKS